MFDMQKIGHRISALRRSRGMTQTELAERLGISFQAVSSWERGNAMPDIAKLPELARMFGVTIDWLLGSPEAVPDQPEAEVAPVEERAVPTQPAALPLVPEESAAPETEAVVPDSLLPFLSEELVAELARKHRATHGTKGLTRYAPFMGGRDVDALAEELVAQGEPLGELVYFVSGDVVDALGERAYASGGLAAMEPYAQEMSSKALERVVLSHVREHGLDGLRSVAPFLNEDVLDGLVRRKYL